MFDLFTKLLNMCMSASWFLFLWILIYDIRNLCGILVPVLIGIVLLMREGGYLWAYLMNWVRVLLKKRQSNEILSQEEYKDKFLYAKNNDIDNAIESIKQGYENSEIPQVIIDKLVQIANG